MTLIVPGIIRCSQSNSYISILLDKKAKLNTVVNKSITNNLQKNIQYFQQILHIIKNYFKLYKRLVHSSEFHFRDLIFFFCDTTQ